MKYVKLADIINIEKGKKNEIVETPSNESKRLIQIDDLRNDNNIKFTNEKNGVFVNENDLLIVWDGANAGTIGYGKNGYIGSTIAALKIKNDNYYTEFIGRYLNTKFNYFQSNATGATIPHINRSSLERINIPLVKFEDQIRIATVLSRIEELIAKRKESIALLDDYVKSVFLDMFGDPVRNEKRWDKKKIKEVAYVKIGPFGSLLHKEDYINNGTPLVNPSHIIDKKIIIDNDLSIDEVKKKELASYLLEEGDLILARRGEIGRLGLVTINEAGYLCGTGSMIIRPIKNLDSVYILYLMSSSRMREILESVAKGVTMKNLNSTSVENIEISIPPINVQMKLKIIIEKVESMKVKYQESLTLLEALYGSVSQRAFRGEL